MSNDKKLKLLQYLDLFPTVLCIMLFIDMNSFPHAKLLGTISGLLCSYYACCFLEFEATYEKRKIFLNEQS